MLQHQCDWLRQLNVTSFAQAGRDYLAVEYANALLQFPCGCIAIVGQYSCVAHCVEDIHILIMNKISHNYYFKMAHC